MKSVFEDKWFRALVVWCGIWQACHLALNIQYCLGQVAFPLPPPQGWTEQAHRIFDGLVASDLVQSTVFLAFVAGYFTRRSWSLVLGLVSLASSMFNSLSFTYFIVATGAWAAHAYDYWMIQILWAPLIVLFVWLCRAFAHAGQVRVADSVPSNLPVGSRV